MLLLNILFLKFIQFWLLELLYFDFCVLLTFPNSFFFHHFLFFQVPQDSPGLSWIFPFPILEFTISLGIPRSPYWGIVFRNPHLDSRFAYCYWSAMALRPLSRHNYEHMYIPTHTYTHTYLYLFMCVCLYLKYRGFQLIPLTPNQYKIHFSLPLFLIFIW